MNTSNLVTTFISALHGNHWILAGAVIVWVLVAALKQGWAGPWIAKRLPPSALPYVAVALGVIGLSAAEVISGKPLSQAVIDGVQSGILAVFGHETVIEGIRSGKEIVPEKPSPKEAA
jgi:hypothetical protein